MRSIAGTVTSCHPQSSQTVPVPQPAEARLAQAEGSVRAVGGGELEFRVQDIKYRQAVAQRLYRTQHPIDRGQKTIGGCGEQAQRGQYGFERPVPRQRADYQYGEATDGKQFQPQARKLLQGGVQLRDAGKLGIVHAVLV